MADYGGTNAHGTGTMRERPAGSGRWPLRALAGTDPPPAAEGSSPPRGGAPSTSQRAGPRSRSGGSLSVVKADLHEGPTETHARKVALDEIGVGPLRDHWQAMQDLSGRRRIGVPVAGAPEPRPGAAVTPGGRGPYVIARDGRRSK